MTEYQIMANMVLPALTGDSAKTGLYIAVAIVAVLALVILGRKKKDDQ